MAEKSPRFAELLTIGIKAIAAREQKNISLVQDELGYALKRSGGSAIEYWRKGYIPDYETVETLANICVKRGGMDKGWLADFLQAAQHPNRQQIIETIFGNDSDISQNLRHNLPRRDYIEFIGRRDELEEIADFLQYGERAWLLTIDGVGGIGKSSLALESAYRLIEGRPPFVGVFPYQAVVWVSAKQEFLTLDGKFPSNEYFRTLADIYTAIADVLQREDVIRSQPQDQNRIVKKILSQHAVLLIVDNLESVADKSVHAFLRHDLPPPCKAMMTTRERINVAHNLRVMGLKKADGLALIKQDAKNADLSLTDEQQQKLYRRTGGIPLVITLTMARLAANGRITDNHNHILDQILADYGKVQKDLVSYCLQSSIDALHSDDARKVLQALSTFAKDAGYEALQFVAGFEDDPLGFEEALLRLEQLSLIDVNEGEVGPRYSMLPMTQDFVLKDVGDQSQQKQTMVESQIGYYLNRLSEIGYDYTPKNWSELGSLDSERENLFGLMTYLDDEKRWREVIEFVTYLYGYLSFRGHWSDYLKWVERTEIATNSLKDSNQFDIELQQAMGLCLSEKCWIQINLGQLNEAKETIDQAINLFDKSDNKNGKATALRHLGLIERRRGNLEKSEEHYLDAKSIWQVLDNKRELASIDNNLGVLALIERNYPKAEKLLLDSLKMKEDLGDIPRLGNTLYYLGETYFFQEKLRQAQTFFMRTCEVTESCGEVLYQARANFYLAKIAVKYADFSVAKQSAIASLRAFRYLGMDKECREVNSLLLEIA